MITIRKPLPVEEEEFPHIKVNAPIATAQLGSNLKIDIPNEHSFKEIMIVYNAPALTGGASGTYIPNSIIASAVVIQDGMPSMNLVANVVLGKVPYAIGMMRENAYIRNHVADSAEYLILRFPGMQCKGKNTYVDLLINTLANIQESGGDRTTLTAGTINVWLISSRRIPKKETRVAINCGRITLGATEGRLSHFINPTQKGYKAKSLMLFIEDNGTPSNSAVAALELWKGNNQLFDGAMEQLQEKVKAKSIVAHNTGFLKLKLNRPINPFELELFTIITSAGTSVNVHWMLISTKKIR